MDYNNYYPAQPGTMPPHPMSNPSPVHQMMGPAGPSMGPQPGPPGRQLGTPGPPMHGQPPPPMGPPGPMGAGPPPPMGPGVNHPQPGMQQQHQLHQHNQAFMGPGPMPAGPGPQYPPNHHQPQPPPPPNSHPHPHPHPHPHSHIPPMHHSPQAAPPGGYLLPGHPAGIERGSPFLQSIPRTEFRIIEFNKRLQNRPRPQGPPNPLPLINSFDESQWWDRLICDFFDEDATLTLTFSLGQERPPEQYTIGRTLIPRFFRSYFDDGASDLSIKLPNARESAHRHMIVLECDQAIITTNLCKNTPIINNSPITVVVHTDGILCLEFVSNSFDNLMIKSWKFFVRHSREYIDRSINPKALLGDSVTICGLTKNTHNYLKLCKVLEPMQDLMVHHRQTRLDPKTCLKQLLYDKYKFRSQDDRPATIKKTRKRKTNTAAGGAIATNKKTRANANNTHAINANNNMAFHNVNNSLMSPATVGGVPDLALSSQDVMVVGEPSILGSDFNDENERRITRLENHQFDSPLNNNANTSTNPNMNPNLNPNPNTNPNANPNADTNSNSNSTTNTIQYTTESDTNPNTNTNQIQYNTNNGNSTLELKVAE